MELIPFLTKVAEYSLSLSVVVTFSVMSLRYLVAENKRLQTQILTIINEGNQRYDRLEERYTAQQNELLKMNYEKDKFVSEMILKVTDSISTLTYTNAKAFKSYKNATENENAKIES